MKQLTLILLLFIFSTQGVFSQEKELEINKSPQELEEYYTMKFKKKKKTARILLISGVSSMAVGVGIAAIAQGYDAAYGVIPFTLGTVAALVSIPFYIKANSYKRKSAEVSSSFQASIGTIQTPNRNNLALGLTYNF